MLKKLFEQENGNNISEGEIYKKVTAFEHTFELRYGYYEEFERENPAVEPMPIYPDFLKNPVYSNEGFPFVTKMQDSCMYYDGKTDDFCECAECRHYSHGSDLIGICTCKHNKYKGEDDL